MAKKSADPTVETYPLYKCVACEQAIELAPEDFAMSAIFCPSCQVHRPVQDFVAVPVAKPVEHHSHAAVR